MNRSRFPNVLCAILLIAMLVIGPRPATAQAGLIGRVIPVCVARVTTPSAAPTLAPATATFDCHTPQTDFGPGDFWVRSAPLSSFGDVTVRSASLWQRRATLYATYGDGVRRVIPMDGRAVSHAIQLGAIVETRLPARTAPLVGLLWRIDGAANLRGILLGPRLATPGESARSNLGMGALYAGFAGLCVALLVYNIALWGALRHRFQLAYCAMLAGLLVYAFSSSGALAWFWPGIANNDRLRVNYAALAATGIAAMQFARHFFASDGSADRLSRLIDAVCGLLFVAAVAFVLLAPRHIALLDHLYSCAFAAQMAVVAPILWRGWQRRSNLLWLFAVAWAAPIALAALRVTTALHLAPWSFWLDNSTLISMAAEALLSSVAIAYRIHLLSRERDEARQQEIAARMLADIDPLTGLLNRRAFLARAIGRAGEQILLVADIDHFKRVNDTLGHDGGDEVLRLFARTLRQSVPAEALVARLGGEEFAILVPANRSVTGDDVLARLRACRMPFDLTVTASIGTCRGAMTRETDWKALYRGADSALFEAKAAGRDRARTAAALARAA